MRTTQEVKAKLTEVQTEINRLNKLYEDDPEIGNKTYVQRNGKESSVPELTFDKQFTILIYERALLKWILNIKD
jgi:hypothetical protein